MCILILLVCKSMNSFLLKAFLTFKISVVIFPHSMNGLKIEGHVYHVITDFRCFTHPESVSDYKVFHKEK